MSAEKMREEFEAWYLGKFCGGQERLFRCVNADQVYYFDGVQSKWDAWQASRAAIEVKLPQEKTARGNGEKVAADLAFNDAVEYCRDAIESLGLKVK